MTKKDYDVGYGKPDPRHQFKKGQSGNPKGRPKGTKNLKTDLQDELKERITFRENGKEKRESKQKVLVKSLVEKAIKGNVQATRIVLDMTMRLLSDENTPEQEAPLNKQEQAILDNLEERILRRRAKKKENNND